MGIERREGGRRAEVVRAVVDHVVHRTETTLTLEGLQDFSMFLLSGHAGSSRVS